MRRLVPILALLVIATSLVSCRGDEPPPEPADVGTLEVAPRAEERVHEPSGPAGYHFGELPAGWSVTSRSGNRIILARADADEEWVVAAVEESIPGDDLERGVAQHRADARRSEGGSHQGSGAVDTAELGPVVWSVNRYDEDEEVRDELVLFVPHPSEYASISLRYVYPSADDTSSRLIELVALAKGIAPGA